VVGGATVVSRVGIELAEIAVDLNGVPRAIRIAPFTLVRVPTNGTAIAVCSEIPFELALHGA
jgi:hypothetical protein